MQIVAGSHPHCTSHMTDCSFLTVHLLPKLNVDDYNQKETCVDVADNDGGDFDFGDVADVSCSDDCEVPIGRVGKHPVVGGGLHTHHKDAADHQADSNHILLLLPLLYLQPSCLAVVDRPCHWRRLSLDESMAVHRPRAAAAADRLVEHYRHLLRVDGPTIPAGQSTVPELPAFCPRAECWSCFLCLLRWLTGSQSRWARAAAAGCELATDSGEMAQSELVHGRSSVPVLLDAGSTSTSRSFRDV